MAPCWSNAPRWRRCALPTTLCGADTKIAGGMMQKTKDVAALRFLADAFRSGAESGQRFGNDRVHPEQPRIAASLPRRSGRQSQSIGQFVVVDQRRAAGGPANVREIGKKRIGNVDRCAAGK